MCTAPPTPRSFLPSIATRTRARRVRTRTTSILRYLFRPSPPSPFFRARCERAPYIAMYTRITGMNRYLVHALEQPPCNTAISRSRTLRRRGRRPRQRSIYIVLPYSSNISSTSMILAGQQKFNFFFKFTELGQRDHIHVHIMNHRTRARAREFCGAACAHGCSMRRAHLSASGY